jgi:drug/metabolite transporter (DMT)-like permease
MLIAVGALSLMDAGLKTLAPHYGTLQITAMRGLATLPLTLAWIFMSTGLVSVFRARFPLHFVRGVLGIVMLASFTYGVRHLPLSDAYTIFFVAPLLITALAVPILRERVDAARWMAIATGFGGVLIVLRPTGAEVLTAPGLAVLACAGAYAVSAIIVRILGRTDSTQSMVFWMMMIVSFGAGALALPTWRVIQPVHWWIIAGIGVSGSIGQYALTEAFNRGEASVIAPFEYTALAWGVGLDWIFWQTTPGPLTLIGAAVIIASGVYLIRRERTVSGAAVEPVLPTSPT